MLFRIPVKGDYTRHKKTGHIYLNHETWNENTYKASKDDYEFVTATVVEPPPLRHIYVNLYEEVDGSADIGNGYETRKDADASSVGKRIACVKVVEGQFDD